jgi:hypothetical protein
MRDQYLKAAPADQPAVIQAIKAYFEDINSEIRWVERARLEAEPRHLDALLKFAARAYRRPLAQEDRDDILAYYHELREKSGLTHEEAVPSSACWSRRISCTGSISVTPVPTWPRSPLAPLALPEPDPFPPTPWPTG